MRDCISRALSWVLSVLAPRRPGRHSAAFLDDQAEPTPVASWTKPWPTPTPEHVRALYTPLRGEEVSLIRPYCRMDDTLELRAICERRRAAVLATLGVDWPYGYDGDQFQALSTGAMAVTA
ncbi:hypothetical protein [Streptomyces sp. WAC01280]|uniref:hypothetical protein n=1 Tax=Streptomyces sp. WAC01280 TaxID=2487424 RepID=UPI000F7A8CF9|nr:hypothetical protein [Streptomyces sp. WAC01280]RSS53175.1 hypothetical protein EF909_27090 [Streptomyces sp. WAC01280]